MSGDSSNRDFSKDKFRLPKPLKSVSKKEKCSEKNKSKQQLKNYWESDFEDDKFEDNFKR